MSPGRGAALGAALVAVLCAGIWLGGHPENLPQPVRDAFVDDATSLNAEALDVIGDNYFRESDRERLADASVDGMVRELRRRYEDRFSHYFDPEDLKAFQESIEGRFTGVGMTVSEVPRGLRVGSVFPRSPAARGGIAAGDLIVAVDGESIAGEKIEVARAKITGPAGTAVTLAVLRPSTNRRRTLELTREEIRVPITSSRVRELDGRTLGYVQLIGFSEGAHAALRAAIERTERRGAEGIVLDLRGNGGGLLREAVLTASIFLDEGDVIVSTKSRTQGDSVYKAVGDPLPPRPTVVLINRDTASAAEILAAALAEDAGATIAGVRSYGKGVFQQVIELENGGALDLTIGEYFTADGTSLAGRGVPPEVRALDDPETRPDEALDRAFRVLAAMTGGPGARGTP